ncbi:MAG: DUF1549 domain-containing protein, partial [Planctomycetales bacterium]|nr:DUF1549 domain-containing protein [Planctomycetales bacterium]
MRVCRLRTTLLAICVLTALASHGLADDALSPEAREFFETKVRPALVEHCYACHSAESKIIRGGLRLDSREGMLRGGDSGPELIPGDAAASLVVSALRHESFEMPPEEKLDQSIVAKFSDWIQRGAAAPHEVPSEQPKPRVDPTLARDHWAFQPLRRPHVPVIDDPELADCVRQPVDAFIAGALDEQGWKPAARADKYTLIRRATFDLIGLPPRPEEIEAFINDDSPESFQRLVDRLLASPHYGQRWGRHWLDLVRYADTNGADENHVMPNAWRYRDWVFRSLNRDQPLDDFIVHQMAGDLLTEGADQAEQRELLTATGMLVIGPKMLAEQDKEKMRIDIIDEQIDTVSRTMMGMTIGCARCHDHKFDPISQADYYALAGI